MVYYKIIDKISDEENKTRRGEKGVFIYFIKEGMRVTE
jgi:hypothetical protein